MQLTIISAGPGDGRLLTAEAEERISAADMILGSERLVSAYGGYRAVTADEVERHINLYSPQQAAVLVSGDAGFFSLAKSLKARFPEAEILPGISSAAYLSAALGIPHEDWVYVSLHGREAAPAVMCSIHRNVFFLTDRKNTPRAICSRLTDFGLGGLTVSVGEDLSLKSERIRTLTAAKGATEDFSPLCALLVQNPNASGTISSIPDKSFIRGDAPMTKHQVRTTVISLLDIAADSTVWDIGAGTGSVSVEAARLCPRGRVMAVEMSPARTELIEKNSRRFSTDNITAVTADAISAMPSLPDPDSVFIGGSGKQTIAVVKAVFSRSPRAVVMTAVTLETVSKILALADSGQIPEPEICQLSVSNIRRAGAHSLLSAENPVFIFSWRRLR